MELSKDAAIRSKVVTKPDGGRQRKWRFRCLCGHDFWIFASQFKDHSGCCSRACRAGQDKRRQWKWFERNQGIK